MADVKISALPAATTPLDGTELAPIVQSGTTKRVTVANLTVGRALTASSLTLTTPLSAGNGGTGQNGYTTGDLLYASDAATLSKLADVATGNALISGGVGTAPSWGKIGLTTHVSGTLGVGNGGTGLGGATPFTSGYIPYASSSSALSFSSAIWSNGTNVSIGTSSVFGSSRLSVLGKITTDTSVAGDVICNFNNSSATGYGLRVAGGASGGGYIAAFSDYASNLSLLLDGAGNLGLGVTPNYKLHVYGGNFKLDSAAASAFFLLSNNSGTSEFGTDSSGLYIQAPTSKSTRFYVGGAQAMTLDASSNLSVGSTSALNYSAKLRIDCTNNQYSAEFYSRGTDYRSYLVLSNDNGVAGVSSYGGSLLFHSGGVTSSTERARIDSSGALLINTTIRTGSKFNVRGPATASTEPYVAAVYSDTAGDLDYAPLLISKYDNNTTTSQVFLRFAINQNSTANGQINANGASQAAFGSWSDARLKENIVDLPPQLANILSLRPVEFDYIATEGGGHQIGFLAQDFEKVYPDAVGKRDDGMKTITGWAKTEARLVKAIHELAANVAELEEKLNG